MPKLQSTDPTTTVGEDSASLTVPGCNLLGPFSTFISLEWPDFNGFIVQPHASNTSPAWGTPFIDSKTGARIFPGTLSGSYPNTSLTKVKGKFKERKSESIQSVGPVNWFGEKISSKASSVRRHVLSYYGPASRHFADPSFQYGSESAHREVYYGGGVVGIAPGPVTGAALTLISSVTKGTYPYHNFFLVVVCIEGGKEVVYRRPCNVPMYKNKITDAQVKYLTQKQDLKATPQLEGWLRIGEATPSDYDTPTTPYFFSEDGKSASAIRFKDRTFDPLSSGDSSVTTEKVGTVVTLSLSESTVSVSLTQNDPPYEFSETGTKTEPGMWTTPPDAYGHTHKYWEETMKVQATMTGAQIVAVDYVDNERILVRLKIDSILGWTKDFAVGMDASNEDNGWNETDPNNGGGHANTFRANGAYQPFTTSPHPDCLGRTDPPGPGDHSHRLWYNTKIDTALEFTVAGVDHVAKLEGYSYEYSDPAALIFSTTKHSRIRVRYFDVRATTLIGQVEVQEHDWSGQKIYWTKAEVGATVLTNKQYTQYVSYVYSGRSVKTAPSYFLENWLSFNEATSWIQMVQQGYDGAQPTYNAAGYDYGTRAWEWTWRKRTYYGDYPSENKTNSKGWASSQYCWFAYLLSGRPPLLDWTQSGWRGTKSLGNNGLAGVGNFAIHPEGHLVGNFYGEDLSKWVRPIVQDQSTLYTVRSGDEGFDPVTQAGGARLYPLGTI